MNPRSAGARSRKREKGAAMVETLLSLFVLFLILFGMLQVFYLFAGQFFTDYAALRGARSRAVGFADYLVQRETRVNAIGGSGLLVSPRQDSVSGVSSQYSATQFAQEKTLIQRYMVGASWLEYEYWFGSSAAKGRTVKTRMKIGISDSSEESTVKTRFTDYAFPETLTRRLFFRDGLELRGSASLRDHAGVYLEN